MTSPWSIALAPVIAGTELAILFIGGTLPTPLYPLYRAGFGFGGVTLTVIYAVYVLGNLIALIFFGRLSDQLGRRPVILLALGFGFAGTLLFLFAEGTVWLFAARILSGLSTGLGAGAATAWIAELQPRRDHAGASSLASAANLTGLGIAPLLAGALARFAPAPLRLCYLVYLLVLCGAAGFLKGAPETIEKQGGGLTGLKLRPRFGVPRSIRLAFIAPAATAFATFALIGFYAALIPSLLAESLHQSSPLLAGTVVFELFLIAAVVAGLSGGLNERAAMLYGLILLPPSLGLLMAAQVWKSMALLLLAAAIAGVASALGYRGSLQVVNHLAPEHQRSEVVSTYLIAVYMGNSLPIIAIGLLSAWLGSLSAHLIFAVVIALLAIVALVLGARYVTPS